MSRPEVSIIVVSYNTRRLTLDCLRSVFSETKCEVEVIVLDNASTDGSPEAIRDAFGSQLKLIVSKDNLGFAAGNNRAAKVAKGEFLLLLNPDTVVLDGAVDRLLQFARRRPESGIWGGRTLFADGRLNPASCWSRQTLWSLLSQAVGLSSLFRRSTLLNPEGLGGWDRSGEREVDIVSGCFLLIRRDLWDRLDGFRERFFMYGEEADLCLRARQLGARPIVSGDATIVHYGGASETVKADQVVKVLRAKMDLIQLHFPAQQRKIGYWLLALAPKSRALAHGVLEKVGVDGADEKRRVWREIVSREVEWRGRVATRR